MYISLESCTNHERSHYLLKVVAAADQYLQVHQVTGGFLQTKQQTHSLQFLLPTHMLINPHTHTLQQYIYLHNPEYWKYGKKTKVEPVNPASTRSNNHFKAIGSTCTSWHIQLRNAKLSWSKIFTANMSSFSTFEFG